MRTSSAFLPVQWIEPNSDFNVWFPSPVFLQPELMHKRCRTTRRLDVFSNACPTKESDAHLVSRFHSCKLTDEKYQYIMNCEPDSIGECFMIIYSFPSFISVPVTFLLSLICFPILSIFYTISLSVPAIQLLLLSCFEIWERTKDRNQMIPARYGCCRQ